MSDARRGPTLGTILFTLFLSALLATGGTLLGLGAGSDALARLLGVLGGLGPLLYFAVELAAHLRRRGLLAEGLAPGDEIQRTLLGGETTGVLGGQRFRLKGTTVTVFTSSMHPTTLGRRELEEIASGIPSRRTGNHAVNPEHRDAVSALLASGSETVLFLERHKVVFEGFERGSLVPVVRALAKLAGPGFVLARHEGPAVCPYCKETVAESTRACDSCRSEHHAECYEEHGGCAIFGCERAPSGGRAKERS